MAFIRGANVVTDGLVLALDAANPKSYPGSGTTWSDLSGNGNSGSLTNGPTFSSTSGGNIQFDGVDDYVGRIQSIDTGQNFSAFAWVNPRAMNIRNWIFGNSYPYSARVGWGMTTVNGYLGLVNGISVTVGADLAGGNAVNIMNVGQWQYVGTSVINGGADVKLYYNGREIEFSNKIVSSGTITYTTPEFSVGRRYSLLPEPWDGRIATATIYNRVLSASEVLQNYNATKARFGIE